MWTAWEHLPDAFGRISAQSAARDGKHDSSRTTDEGADATPAKIPHL
jgi:hypothetical protein